MNAELRTVNPIMLLTASVFVQYTFLSTGLSWHVGTAPSNQRNLFPSLLMEHIHSHILTGDSADNP